MKGNPLVYRLIFDGNLFDDNPSLISEFRMEDCGFDGQLMSCGRFLCNEWPSEFAVFVRGTEPVDYFLCGAHYQVVSENFVKVICSLGDMSEVEFLPIKVFQEDKKEIPCKYSVMNVTNTLDALDWEQTCWINKKIPYNDPNAVLNIIKPAFKAEVVNGVNIFQISVKEKIRTGTYISALLKRNLERTGATLGLEFMPIKVTSG